MDVIAQNAPRMGRRLRRPNHSHHLRARAFQIQPFMIAPVLAGETLKNLMFQARVVTDPIKNPLIGWWKEYYYFYVKLTDLDFYLEDAYPDMVADNSDDTQGFYVKMLLNDVNYSATADDLSSDTTYDYAYTGQQPFVRYCLECVRDWYFRDDADRGQAHDLDNMPLAMVNNAGALDSAIQQSEYGPAAEDADLLGDASDATLNVSEIDEALRRYQFAKANGLTDASYEDYLASFGISTKVPVIHKPELVRYVRQWQYPSNTVEPTTGVPSSAVSWSIQERADKDRFFKEPGFLFGVTVTRPKVYLAGQKGAMAGWLDRAADWLPTMFGSDTNIFFKHYAASAGPFYNIANTGGYWFDVRDVYSYGDQFVNFALTETDAGLVALPSGSSTTQINKKFVSDTDIDALFVTPASKQWVREDGMTALTIASRQRDLSPTT